MSSSADRINAITQHMTAPSEMFPEHTAGGSPPKSGDDVVIVSAVRTPIARGKKGSFKDTTPDDLLAAVLEGVVKKVGLDPKLVQDIQVGNCLPPGGGAMNARMAEFYAGFPIETTVTTVNRQCSSGLQACANIVSSIKAGFIDIGIGAGVESMTQGWGKGGYEFSEKMGDYELAADCLIPMGVTSENVAADFGISREYQDKFSAESHARAAKAQKLGHFEEIIPVEVTVKDDDGNAKKVLVTKDEGVREGTTVASLSKLAPSFKKDGSTTAGNSSQVSDGAAAVLFMKRSTAEKLKLPILARFRAFSVVGVPPRVMGVGPAYAIPAALKQAGISKDDVAVYEINEAFASQATYSVDKLGLDYAKVNPLGGAIALGHPLGCTGARQIATILPELRRRKGRYGVTSMCIGSGMGAASVIENEQL